MRYRLIERLKIYPESNHPHSQPMQGTNMFPSVNFETSKWNPIIADPSIYRGYLIKLENSGESFKLSAARNNAGTRRFPQNHTPKRPRMVKAIQGPNVSFETPAPTLSSSLQQKLKEHQERLKKVGQEYLAKDKKDTDQRIAAMKSKAKAADPKKK